VPAALLCSGGASQAGALAYSALRLCPLTLGSPCCPPPHSGPCCSPLVFDLTLAVDNSSLAADGGGWRILHVYGSPNPNLTVLSADGTIMQVGTGASLQGGVSGLGTLPVPVLARPVPACTLFHLNQSHPTSPHSNSSPHPAHTARAFLPQIHTLFPSPKTEEGIKGGVVLMRMRAPTSGNTPLTLTVTYTDRENKHHR